MKSNSDNKRRRPAFLNFLGMELGLGRLAFWVLPLVTISLVAGCYSSSEENADEKNVSVESPPEVASQGSSEGAKGSSEGAEEKKVGFFVDFGKGKKEGIRTEVPWKKGLNAISVIEAAVPKVTCKYRGQGATAFLTSIDGVENDLSARKYWIYYVNGKKGKVGAGAYQLEPEDKVLWRFGNDEIE